MSHLVIVDLLLLDCERRADVARTSDQDLELSRSARTSHNGIVDGYIHQKARCHRDLGVSDRHSTLRCGLTGLGYGAVPALIVRKLFGPEHPRTFCTNALHAMAIPVAMSKVKQQREELLLLPRGCRLALWPVSASLRRMLLKCGSPPSDVERSHVLPKA